MCIGGLTMILQFCVSARAKMLSEEVKRSQHSREQTELYANWYVQTSSDRRGCPCDSELLTTGGEQTPGVGAPGTTQASAGEMDQCLCHSMKPTLPLLKSLDPAH